MKKIKAAVVGYGDRGSVYASYSLKRPEELEIVAIVDPLEYKLKYFGAMHHIPENRLFTDLDEFLNANIDCDVVINATMDQLHYQTAIKIIDKGYNMLLEKPITSNKDELIEIERKAIARNLSLLKEAGYDIESTRKGSYLASRDFEDSELRLLIDGVLSSRYINAKHSKDLIEKLCKLSNERFKSNVKNIYSVNEWSKSKSVDLFYNIS